MPNGSGPRRHGEALQKDLDSRVEDVTAALERHRQGMKKQRDAVRAASKTEG